MKLQSKVDKKLLSNLKILLLCSKFETIQNSTKRDELIQDQVSIIDDSNNTDFKDFLLKEMKRTIKINSQKKQIDNITTQDEQTIDYSNITSEDLASFTLLEDAVIPPQFQDLIEHHQSVSLHINNLSKNLDEHKELREILRGHTDEMHEVSRKMRVSELTTYLNSKKHTKDFRTFAKEMQTRNPLAIILKYKKSAQQLAEEKGIADSRFMEKLYSAFNYDLDDLVQGFNSEKNKILFPSITKLSALVSVSALLIGGAVSGIKKGNETTQIDSEISQSDSATSLSSDKEQPDINIIGDMVDNNDLLPISNIIKIDSSESMIEDIKQKTYEAYKYNTGNTDFEYSNLSDLKLGFSTNIVYTATLNGKTLHFSSLSPYGTNANLLLRALESTGAVIEESKQDIYYLYDDEKNESLAICSDDGKPLKSGKVTSYEYTSPDNPKECYDQNKLAVARNILSNKGIDSSALSDEELMGYYLFNVDEQDIEFSKAFSSFYKLPQYVQKHVHGEPDTYTINEYNLLSRNLGNSFNENASIEQYNEKNTNTNNEDHYYER